VLQRAVEGGVESFLDEDERFQNFVRGASRQAHLQQRAPG
jgi:hypothetical protein